MLTYFQWRKKKQNLMEKLGSGLSKLNNTICSKNQELYSKKYSGCLIKWQMHEKIYFKQNFLDLFAKANIFKELFLFMFLLNKSLNFLVLGNKLQKEIRNCCCTCHIAILCTFLFKMALSINFERIYLFNFHKQITLLTLFIWL